MGLVSCDSNGATNEITIYGNVIDRTTGQPLYNVLIQEKNKVGGSSVTGNDGNYEFTLPLEGSSNGKYYLVASKEKYSSSEYELEMNKVDKNRRVKVDFQLTKESITYTGTVVDKQNKPIVDAKISATYRDAGNVFNIGTTAITSSGGTYSLELPRPQNFNQWQFNITASTTGYADLTHTLNQNVDDMGKTITLNFVMGSNEVTISGKVTNSNGTSLQNAILEVYSDVVVSYLGNTMTDSYGKYAFSFSPYSGVWDYKFTMRKEGYFSETMYLTLSPADAGKSYTLDFVLTKE